MAKKNEGSGLSRREQQIMDIVYALGEATVAQVLEEMADPPSYSTVRKQLTILSERGHLRHREENRKYIYRPTKTRGKAGKSALTRVVKTFYEGSLEKAVAALLQGSDAKVSDSELRRLSKLIEEARRDGN